MLVHLCWGWEKALLEDAIFFPDLSPSNMMLKVANVELFVGKLEVKMQASEAMEWETTLGWMLPLGR